MRVQLLVPVLLSAAACADAPTSVRPDGEGDRIVVTNDEALLSERVQSTGGVDVPILGTPGAGVLLRATADTNPKFTLHALVRAPSVAGRSLLATHVALRGEYAYVSYMTLGETALGAVEVFDINDPTNPRLVSQALLSNTDVTALAVDGNHVYLATASHDGKFAEPAVLERLQLQGGKLTTKSDRVAVPSFVATGVAVTGGQVYVTSGSGGPGLGGLTAFSRSNLSRVKSDLFADARAVSSPQGSYLAVSQGSPARLRIYDPSSLALTATVPLSGGLLPDSKSAVTLDGEWAFVAAGDGGVQVVDMSRGALSGTLPRPSVPPGFPAAHEHVTNAVTVMQDIVLTADGAGGVSVAVSDHKRRRSGERVAVQALGRLGLNGSANFVAAGNTALFVATGAGGLQILTIR